MSDPKRPSSLEGLGERIKSAKARHEGRQEKPGKAGAHGGLALGMRIATEMAAALAVGVGMGWLLDEWLGTRPWMMIVFFIFGAAAAFVNLMRVAKAAERAAEEARRAPRLPDDGADGSDRGE